MSRIRVSLLCALIVAIGICVAILTAAAERDPFRRITVGEQVVLYTIHRGGRETHREAIGRLYALAEKMEMEIKGDLTLVALNNPFQADGRHMLTEIRIPVNQEALLKHAGTLDAMTDVKRLPPYNVLCFRRYPDEKIGRRDLLKLYEQLYRNALDRRIILMFGPEETFIGKSHELEDYVDMRTDIKVPMWKDILPGGE